MQKCNNTICHILYTTVVVTMALDGQAPPLDGVADENSACICPRCRCKGLQHRLRYIMVK